MTTYSAGLRVSEQCPIELAGIESAPDRMCLKVRAGKGGRERYTLLGARLLETLREYWGAYRPRVWLFPSAAADGQMGVQTAQRQLYIKDLRSRRLRVSAEKSALLG